MKYIESCASRRNGIEDEVKKKKPNKTASSEEKPAIGFNKIK